jgi:hypothetical protein
MQRFAHISFLFFASAQGWPLYADKDDLSVQIKRQVSCSAITSPINGDCNYDLSTGSDQVMVDIRNSTAMNNLYSPTDHTTFADNLPMLTLPVSESRKMSPSRFTELVDSDVPVFEKVRTFFEMVRI